MLIAPPCLKSQDIGAWHRPSLLRRNLLLQTRLQAAYCSPDSCNKSSSADSLQTTSLSFQNRYFVRLLGRVTFELAVILTLLLTAVVDVRPPRRAERWRG